MTTTYLPAGNCWDSRTLEADGVAGRMEGLLLKVAVTATAEPSLALLTARRVTVAVEPVDGGGGGVVTCAERSIERVC